MLKSTHKPGNTSLLNLHPWKGIRRGQTKDRLLERLKIARSILNSRTTNKKISTYSRNSDKTCIHLPREQTNNQKTQQTIGLFALLFVSKSYRAMACKHLNGEFSEEFITSSSHSLVDGKLEFNEMGSGGTTGYSFRCGDCGNIFHFSFMSRNKPKWLLRIIDQV